MRWLYTFIRNQLSRYLSEIYTVKFNIPQSSAKAPRESHVFRREIRDHAQFSTFTKSWSLRLEVKCKTNNAWLEWEEYHFDRNKSKRSNDLSFHTSNNQNSYTRPCDATKWIEILSTNRSWKHRGKIHTMNYSVQLVPMGTFKDFIKVQTR